MLLREENPKPSSRYFTGTLLHRESILFEFGRQFPVICPEFVDEHIGGFGLNREWIVAVVLTTGIRLFEAEPHGLSLRAAGS
jgi:hypothetical protein